MIQSHDLIDENQLARIPLYTSLNDKNLLRDQLNDREGFLVLGLVAAFNATYLVDLLLVDLLSTCLHHKWATIKAIFLLVASLRKIALAFVYLSMLA
jgi:hypothetical protein